MKLFVAILCLGAAMIAPRFVSPARAQVINGEGTYEDGAAHVPPPPDVPPNRDARDEGKAPDAPRTTRPAAGRD